jgi:hypothetical protein
MTLSREWSTAPSEPFFVTAHLDFQAIDGSSAGVYLQGSKSTVRLVRRDLDGASIMLERSVDRDVRVPDFPGSPPIFLRLEVRDGSVSGSFSRDGNQYERLGATIPLSDVGEIRGYGVEAILSHWLRPGRRPPARWIAIEEGRLRWDAVPTGAVQAFRQ